MPDPEPETIIISEEEEGKRLDSILRERYRKIKSRTYFQMLIENGEVLLNGLAVKKRVRPKVGDEVEICFALTPEISVQPENIPLNIIFEDEHLLVVNKSAGMVVHPAAGNWTGTFVNAFLYYCSHLPRDLSDIRPGIVHRLDKDTSGVLIGAKTALAHQRLVEQFSGRVVYKEYSAICLGNPGEGEFRSLIGRHPVDRKKMSILQEGGREAVTKYKTLFFDGFLSLVEVVIKTGRTHQIRVHFSHHRTPVLGDSVYGSAAANKKYQAVRQMLHANKICLDHPITKKAMEFVAPVPDDMAIFTRRLQKGGRG